MSFSMYCVSVMAVNIESSVPRPSVMAKPRIVPVPRKKSTPAAMSVVTLESKIVVNARLKPESIERRSVFPWIWYSSLKCSTLDLVLLLEMLENQHVRIDRHADAEDDTRDARQRQRRIEDVEQREQHDGVRHERDVGDEAGDAVEEQHEEQHGADADGERELRFILGVLSERRSDRTRLDDVDLHGQRTAPEHDREVLCLLERPLPGDLRLAAEDRLAHVRRREHLAVEQDGDRAADVLRREVCELLRALIRELEVDDVLPILLVRRRLCVLEVGTRKDRVAVLILELEHRRLADRLDGGVRVLDTRQLDDDAALALALDDRLREAERVDALLHDGDDAVHRIVVDLGDIRILCLEHDVRAALQVESLADGIRQWTDECEENADNRHNADDEFQQTVFSQLIQSFLAERERSCLLGCSASLRERHVRALPLYLMP